jgi:hypothetical protein
MQNKFIELNSAAGDLVHHINPIMICNITEYDNFSIVYTIGGQVINVKENPNEIKKLIEDSEKFTLITK